MSNSKFILALDFGTQGPKSAIVSTNKGEVIDWAFQEISLHAEKGGCVEQDPDEWWNAIINTSKQVISNRKVNPEDIVGVCNSSQWSGTVALNEDGEFLNNCMIWMDTRGAVQIEKFYKSLIKVSGYSLSKILKWIKRTGGGPSQSGKDPIAHILWLKENMPDIYSSTYKFLEPQDYVNFKLTGKIAASFASIHMHWITDIRNINDIKYSKTLMKSLKVDPKKFPALKNSTDVLGPVTNEFANAVGLKPDTKVVMGAPDLHSATIGSGAVKDYETHIYIGTSDWVLCHVPFKKTDITHNMASIPSAIPGRYMIANEQEIAGGALKYLRDNILYHKDELLIEEAVPDVYKIFDRMVEEAPPGSNGLIFTPWLIGERTPVENHTIRGGLYNLSLEMNRRHLIRAIFEGIAYNVRWLFMYVENFIKKWRIKEDPTIKKSGIVIPELNIIGGGAQSDVWCQIFADVLNRPIKQVKNPIQTNARGAAFIASVGLGLLTWDQIPRLMEYSNVFKPNSDNKKVYDNLFREYLNIYDAMRKIYKRLNKYS
ncbi:MAG: FGGY-family carbohydrate kinase [Candidatus Thorarchaeota archaeon]